MSDVRLARAVLSQFEFGEILDSLDLTEDLQRRVFDLCVDFCTSDLEITWIRLTSKDIIQILVEVVEYRFMREPNKIVVITDLQRKFLEIVSCYISYLVGVDWVFVD